MFTWDSETISFDSEIWTYDGYTEPEITPPVSVSEWSWDNVNISFDQTCFTYDGSNGCQAYDESWSWDTEVLRFDQICWTYDGYSNCRKRGGSQFYDTDKIKQRRLNEEILREDQEIAEFLRTLLSKGLI